MSTVGSVPAWINARKTGSSAVSRKSTSWGISRGKMFPPRLAGKTGKIINSRGEHFVSSIPADTASNKSACKMYAMLQRKAIRTYQTLQSHNNTIKHPHTNLLVQRSECIRMRNSLRCEDCAGGVSSKPHICCLFLSIQIWIDHRTRHAHVPIKLRKCGKWSWKRKVINIWRIGTSWLCCLNFRPTVKIHCVSHTVAFLAQPKECSYTL